MTLKHGDNFILTLVSHSSLGDEMSSRQILQTAGRCETSSCLTKKSYKNHHANKTDSPFIYSTQPRHADFGIIFIIIAAFTIVMIFGLVFISYELINMGPGDNIAYKLSAAATKKNQASGLDCCLKRLLSNIKLTHTKVKLQFHTFIHQTTSNSSFSINSTDCSLSHLIYHTHCYLSKYTICRN